MKKDDKKAEKKIVRALSKVCDTLTAELEGFCWLTHFVDYANVPQSLRIVVVFDTELALSKAQGEGLQETAFALVGSQLEKCDIFIADRVKSILFDTEEKGADVDSTRWCRKHALT